MDYIKIPGATDFSSFGYLYDANDNELLQFFIVDYMMSKATLTTKATAGDKRINVTIDVKKTSATSNLDVHNIH